MLSECLRGGCGGLSGMADATLAHGKVRDDTRIRRIFPTIQD